MTGCFDPRTLQEYLDGELSEADSAALARHAAACARCSGELALYRRTFESLERLALWSPSPHLTERVLDRALPSRVRRRWVATVGLGYAGALAACLASVAFWATRPGARALLTSFTEELSRRLVQTIVFVLNALAFTVVSLANGWGLVTAAGQRLAPLGRALASLVSTPGVQLALVTAGVACVALLWWMRPREKGQGKEVRHVGVLGI